MPRVIIGKPESNEPVDDETTPSWYIHENLYCTREPRDNGIWLKFWDKNNKFLFDKHFPNDQAAMGFIEAKKEFFGEGKDESEKSKD